MARTLNQLTAREVASLKEPGRHADGGGLYLRITPAGGRSWVSMKASNGKRAEIGISAAASVSLATARRIAGEMREAVATGKDPRSVLSPTESESEPEIPTFGAFAEQYISSVEEGWKNPVHRQQWRSSLRDHASHLRDLSITDISTDDVLAVLQPIWLAKAETAKRVRGRIEKVLGRCEGPRSPPTRQHESGNAARSLGTFAPEAIKAPTWPPSCPPLPRGACLHSCVAGTSCPCGTLS